MRSSRVAADQLRVAAASAWPSTGESIAGTLIAAIAAVIDCTDSVFCARVFWRMEMMSPISVKMTATAATICETR